MFSQVSVCPQGGVVSVRWGLCPGSLHPRGFCLGVSVQGGCCAAGVCQGDPRTVTSRLLECILVIILNWCISTYQYFTGVLVVARSIQNSHHFGRRSHQSHHQRHRIHDSNEVVQAKQTMKWVTIFSPYNIIFPLQCYQYTVQWALHNNDHVFLVLSTRLCFKKGKHLGLRSGYLYVLSITWFIRHKSHTNLG